ncbi:MAG: CPBP family intramembrane metalloprotease [Bacteroidia bacterium]|nr:CPBP family intramembrane metalloprotease [Bacteroidia bacterium]
MTNKILFNNYSTSIKILFLAGIALVSLGVFSLLSIVMVTTIYDIPLLSNPGVLKDTSNVHVLGALKLMQVMQAVGLFIVPVLIFARLCSTNIWNYLMLHKKPFMYSVFCTVLLMMSVQPFINWMAELNSMMPVPQWMRDSEQQAAEVTKTFLKMSGTGDLLINLFMIALIPAIGEELLFRGALQPLLQKLSHNKHIGIWLAAILFSALHMQFLGFFPRMFMGAAFGYLLVWSGSLWLPIVAHFMNNGGAVVLSYLVQKKGLSEESETFGTGQGDIIFVIISALIASVMMFAIYRFEKQKTLAQ